MSPSPIDSNTVASSDGESKSVASTSKATPSDPSKFQPIDRSETTPDLQLPDQRWLTILEAQCTHGADIFEEVMLNFIKNPNVTSSFLFRADILYDSSQAGTPDHQTNITTDEIKPRQLQIPGWAQQRVIVRLSTLR